MKKYLAYLVGITSLSLAATCHSFRCGSKIVSTGNTQARVEQICGSPSEQRTRYTTRSIDNLRNRELKKRLKRSKEGRRNAKIEVRIDTWTYYVGSRGKAKEVIFEEGRVIDVRNAD